MAVNPMPGFVVIRSNRRHRFRYFLASAVLLTLAQPPFPTGWLAYIALVPFLIGMEGLRGRRAFSWGIVWAVMVNSLGLYWVAMGHTGGFFGALLYLGIVDGLLVWLLCFVREEKRALLLPFLWTGFIFVKSLGEMGFPWLTLALTQTYTPAAIQGAELVGAWGLDLWVATINCLIYMGMRRSSEGLHDISVANITRIFAPALLTALVVLLYGRIIMWAGGAGESTDYTELRTSEPAGPVPEWIEQGTDPLRVAIIQGSIRPRVKLAPQLFEHNLYLYDRLTRAAVGTTGRLDLVVWPETAIPHYLTGSVRSRRFVIDLQTDIGIPLLIGAFSSEYREMKYSYYNSAFMISRGKISSGENIYHKRVLVPFGERVPYQQIFGFLADWSMGWSDFSMGKDAPLMGGSEDTPGVPPIGVLICYESIFTRLVRTEVVDGAQVLAVITNDSWFGRTTGPYQHTMAAALRAVEFRRPVIRAANSGVSALIDRWGRVHNATRLYVKDAVIGQVWPEMGFTPYARTGDWLPVVALVTGILGLVLFREPNSKRAVLKQE